jgi:hypothetical protein
MSPKHFEHAEHLKHEREFCFDCHKPDPRRIPLPDSLGRSEPDPAAIADSTATAGPAAPAGAAAPADPVTRSHDAGR